MKVITARPIFFLLISWDLPESGGLELVHEIRRHKPSKGLPCGLIGPPPGPQALKMARQLDVDFFYMGEPRWEGIRPKLLKTLQDRPPALESDWRRADYLMAEGRSNDALDALHRNMAELLRRSASLNTEIGKILLKQGQVRQALTHLESAAADDPTASRTLNQLGQAYTAAGRPEDAVRCFEKALKTDPQNRPLVERLGETLLEAGMFRKAENHFHDMLNRDQEDRHALNRLGVALRKQGKHEEAVNLYRRALYSEPNDEHLYFNLGRAHYEAGRPIEAARAFRRALEINPELDAAAKYLKKIPNAGG
jgi:tetratricopeptide (TPR) repeat protein